MIKRDISIGVAVAMNEGLIAPVVKNADETSLMGIARAVNDSIAIRPMVYLALTFDHRLSDGAIGDQFMQKLRRFLGEYGAG